MNVYSVHNAECELLCLLKEGMCTQECKPVFFEKWIWLLQIFHRHVRKFPRLWGTLQPTHWFSKFSFVN